MWPSCMQKVDRKTIWVLTQCQAVHNAAHLYCFAFALQRRESWLLCFQPSLLHHRTGWRALLPHMDRHSASGSTWAQSTWALYLPCAAQPPSPVVFYCVCGNLWHFFLDTSNMPPPLVALLRLQFNRRKGEMSWNFIDPHGEIKSLPLQKKR